MKAFFAVTNQNKWKSLKSGDSSFWCIYEKYDAHIGDVLLLYKTVTGLVQLYRITEEPSRAGQFDCEMRGMFTIPMKLIVTFENFITVSEIKTNPILRESGPVGRNFQQTVFMLHDFEWNEIVKLLIQKNPNLESILRDMKVSETPKKHINQLL